MEPPPMDQVQAVVRHKGAGRPRNPKNAQLEGTDEYFKNTYQRLIPNPECVRGQGIIVPKLDEYSPPIVGELPAMRQGIANGIDQYTDAVPRCKNSDERNRIERDKLRQAHLMQALVVHMERNAQLENELADAKLENDELETEQPAINNEPNEDLNVGLCVEANREDSWVSSKHHNETVAELQNTIKKLKEELEEARNRDPMDTTGPVDGTHHDANIPSASAGHNYGATSDVYLQYMNAMGFRRSIVQQTREADLIWFSLSRTRFDSHHDSALEHSVTMEGYQNEYVDYIANANSHPPLIEEGDDEEMGDQSEEAQPVENINDSSNESPCHDPFVGTGEPDSPGDEIQMSAAVNETIEDFEPYLEDMGPF